MQALATTTPTTAPADDADDSTPRVDAVRAVLDRFERAKVPPSPQLFDALSEGMLDAVLARDATTLSEVAHQLRRITAHWSQRRGELAWAEALGQLRTALVLAVGATDRLPSTTTLSTIGAGTLGHRVLRALKHSESMAARLLADRLDVGGDALSRTMGSLMQNLLVTRVKIGREVFWEITPRGRDVLGELNAVARAMRGRRRSRRGVIPSESQGAEVFDLRSGEPLHVDPRELDAKRREAGSPREESWLMLLKLLSQRPSAIGDRLKVWDPLVRFASADPRFLALPPDASENDLRTAHWKALNYVYGRPLERQGWGTVQPPLWDAFAHVPGHDGRRGIVLIEAKSHLSELRANSAKPRGESNRRKLEQVLSDTSRYLDATQRWKVWPPYPDAARRLAFLHYLLQKPDVEAWICNIYFVEPPYRDTDRAGHLPESREQWELNLIKVRESLSLKQQHPLSPHINHEYFVAP